MGGKDNVRQRKPNKGGEQDMKSEPKIKHKPKGKGKKSSNLAVLMGGGICALVFVMAVQWYLTELPEPLAGGAELTRPPKPTKAKPAKAKKPDAKKSANKRDSLEWSRLSRDLPSCMEQQEELMTMPVYWPGFHAMCIDSVSESGIAAHLHNTSGRHGSSGTRLFEAPAEDGSDVIGTLLSALQDELGPHEYRDGVDRMVSTSDYEFPPNPWKFFTAVGNPVETDEDLRELGRGAMLYLYTGGQFIWPGVRIGHKTHVPVPVMNHDGSAGEKIVELTTVSLRPTALVLSNFLSDDECAFIKQYARSRMQPSGLAMMDSSGDSRDVRTSTQTFMERNGSPQIRALEERAHNLTRLPYDLGENIQVVRYEEGQKYGAHRDFFNPNDYHRQPHMLSSVEYGARNRLATVFWYLETVGEGNAGETFFPRALNAEGKEYTPWNGDHEDCYRGIVVPPVQGNAVLFYSMVPDGRLDERSLHGGCKPKGGAEKWGANQWIWNHPKRHRGTYPRRGAKRPAQPLKTGSKPGCEDRDGNCAAWAESGECDRNPEYMGEMCAASCGTC